MAYNTIKTKKAMPKNHENSNIYAPRSIYSPTGPDSGDRDMTTKFFV